MTKMKYMPPPSKRLSPLDPPYAIRTLQQELDPMVEGILASSVQLPKSTTHGHSGRPLCEPMITPHSPQTNNGYARNSLGGFFTT
ncbi:hypothetical protein GUITHDRAFT_116502 [Guillardia theta CCMP2712]|uniref:Uncharacterized protein n=1 Tax=Guillardia theta (strain CCMP2712) TaxID=905079 RepID=L1IMB5_GUITC|nr:hypothetical protein GUITHDRAFT_116502 [Guillardia theta CCMP2712]EKX37386.1 hypothetical protein GUITHDRAFT_116502 [Guillardia theta CCMP2712]|mmetsp:Transcript_49985/g.156462  ORF Transcript_49985/g.156462 Transcript_49985/m.156462 type:complete len:85 (-) Transcript_49985:1271-1525(-)|eukprot:XP_005824366.1 hypothetical protein GUITHDRAFT_116502 [Guillardia theta CCMP2712]